MTPPTGNRARDLSASLEKHVAGDAIEADMLARMCKLCESVADPFSRANYVPGHFTASAFIVSPGGDALLLILHQKLERWLQPGGHVDAADTDLLSAALREVREEVGMVDLTVVSPGLFDVDIHEIPARKAEPSHAHFDVRFLLQARSLAYRAGSDAKAARWVPLDEITLTLSDQSVMRAVGKLRKRAGCGV